MTALPGPGGDLLLVVVGESEKTIERPGYRVFSLEQVLEHAAGPAAVSIDAPTKPEDVFIRLVASSPDAQFSTFPLTHVNFTAAVHALHHVAPSQRRLTAADIVLSFISPRRPVGLSIALTAGHVGAALTVADHGHEDGVAVLAACKPLRPSVLYLTPRQAHSLSVVLKDLGTQAFVANDGLYQRALYAKSHHLRAGYLGPHWIWDRVLFATIRTETFLDRIRLVVVVSEGADQPGRSTLDVLRIHLGCPVVSTLAHPRLPTLIAAAHPFDLQYNDERERGPMDAPNVHVGAGVVNLEIKLVPEGGEAAYSEHDQRGRVRRHVADRANRAAPDPRAGRADGRAESVVRHWPRRAHPPQRRHHCTIVAGRSTITSRQIAGGRASRSTSRARRLRPGCARSRCRCPISWAQSRRRTCARPVASASGARSAAIGPASDTRARCPVQSAARKVVQRTSIRAL